MFTATVRRKRHINLSANLTGPKKVKVGFPAGKASGSNIQKAIWQEFGTRGGRSGGGWGGPIPERPFMRNTMRRKRSSYRSQLRASASKLLTGKASFPLVLSKLGIDVQGDIQGEIVALRTPPNAPVTIARKGSSNPLIDSGAMRQAVTWKLDDE